MRFLKEERKKPKAPAPKPTAKPSALVEALVKKAAAPKSTGIGDVRALVSPAPVAAPIRFIAASNWPAVFRIRPPARVSGAVTFNDNSLPSRPRSRPATFNLAVAPSRPWLNAAVSMPSTTRNAPTTAEDMALLLLLVGRLAAQGQPDEECPHPGVVGGARPAGTGGSRRGSRASPGASRFRRSEGRHFARRMHCEGDQLRRLVRDRPRPVMRGTGTRQRRLQDQLGLTRRARPEFRETEPGAEPAAQPAIDVRIAAGVRIIRLDA